MRGLVLLLLAVTPPRGSLGSQPPCLLLPLPLLLSGLRKLTGRAARQGDPAPRHQVALPVPATPSRRLTQRAQTGTPAAGVGRPHPLQAAIGKLSLALTSTLSPCKAQQRQTLALRLRAVSAQVGLTRTAATRCSRPASCWASPPGTPAASCRPMGWGHPRATCRCEARLQAPLMVAMGEPHGAEPQAPSFPPWLQTLPEGPL